MKPPDAQNRAWPVLIYDAECRICVASKKWIERWDRKRQIRFLPFQSEEAKKWIPEMASLECLDAMRLINCQRTVLSGIDAFRGMLPYLPLGKIIAVLFYLPGIPRWAEWAYRILAKNRYRWFGPA